MSLTCEIIIVGLATMATLELGYIAWLLSRVGGLTVSRFRPIYCNPQQKQN